MGLLGGTFEIVATDVLPADLSNENIPLIGAGNLLGATGFVQSIVGPTGVNVVDWTAAYNTTSPVGGGGGGWSGKGIMSPTQAHDIFLEFFNGINTPPDSQEKLYAQFTCDDDLTKSFFSMKNDLGIFKIVFFARAGATSAPMPVAQQTVTGSRGGRDGLTSLLAALGVNGYNLVTDSTVLGVPLTRQIFNAHATGTYTTPAHCVAILVECIGAGGAGGGVATVASDGNCGQSGGGGAYSAKLIQTPAGSYAYTVGTGGTPGSAGANPGNPGGDTSFGSGPTLCLAKGGNGGAGTTALAGATLGIGATGGAAGSGIGDITLSGCPAEGTVQTGVAVNRAGMGGCPAGPYSAGGAIEKIGTGTGNTASGNGGGGGGGVIQSGSASVAGGSGADGLIVVTEYY